VRFVWESARKDLRRMLRDPAALLLWLAIPLLIAGVIFLAFGGSEPQTPEASLLVADHDRTAVSGLLIATLDRLPVIAADTVGEARGLSRVTAGRASALLVIPKGFGNAVLEERPMELSLVTNPAQRVLPGIVAESLDALFDLASYAQRLLRQPLREIRADLEGGAAGPSDSTIARVRAELNRATGRLKPYLAPPLVALETRLEGGGAAQPGFGSLFLPGLLFMTLLFVAEGLGGDLWRERSQGTLRRALVSPQPVHTFLAGKLLAGAILIAGICAVALPVQSTVFGIGLARLPLAFAWSVFSGVVFLSALMLLQLLASSQRTAGIFTSMVLFPLLMVGGSFFPFESMPAWLSRIGRMTPNGWALTQLEGILRGTTGPADLIAPLAGLAAVGAACFAFGARRLGRGFAGGS
jgi:ABC-type Na+ efflux pump permease subunit